MNPQRILVANAKGGCGKTTIATNIASHYAGVGKKVRLFDHDTQGSALDWISRRPAEVAEIVGIDASRNSDHRFTRSWQLRVPPGTDMVIIDSPAGADVSELTSLIQQHDSVIIPVLPSPIDIHATAYFIKELLTTGSARKRGFRLCVVANRMRKNTLMYHSLERFLFSLNIPFISSLRDTQLYARAIELGIGVQEIANARNRVDKDQWAPIVRWLDTFPADERASITPLLHHSER